MNPADKAATMQVLAHLINTMQLGEELRKTAETKLKELIENIDSKGESNDT